MRLEANTEAFNIPEFSHEISFAIKPYRLRPKALSLKLVSISESSDIALKGTFGTGLNLSNDYNGRTLILTIGTGILPFMDLFDFLLKKSIYQVLKKENLSQLCTSVKPEQEYGEILKNASFEFYGSFNHSNDFLGADWIAKLEQISKRHDLGIFSSQINVETKFEGPIERFEKIEKGVIDKDFLRSKIFNKNAPVKKTHGESSDIDLNFKESNQI